MAYFEAGEFEEIPYFHRKRQHDDYDLGHLHNLDVDEVEEE
jgi:hypothetical protein